MSRFGMRLPKGKTTIHVTAVSGNVDGSRTAEPKVPLKVTMLTGAPWSIVALQELFTLLAALFAACGFSLLVRSTTREEGRGIPFMSVVVAVLLVWWMSTAVGAVRTGYGYVLYKPKLQGAPTLTPISAYQANRAAYEKASVRAGSSSRSYGGGSSRSYYRSSYSYGK